MRRLLLEVMVQQCWLVLLPPITPPLSCRRRTARVNAVCISQSTGFKAQRVGSRVSRVTNQAALLVP